MIRWQDAFNAGDVSFLFTAIAAQLLLTLPGLAMYYRGASRNTNLAEIIHQFPIVLASMSIAWCLWGYSIAFAPGLGTAPEFDRNQGSQPMLTFDEMIKIEITSTEKDNSSNLGRGGIIGGRDYMLFDRISPISGAEKPVFPSRRPFHTIPHLLFLAFHMGLFVAAPLPLLLVLVGQLRPVGISTFAVLWGTVVYAPLTHSVWGDGWLESFGVIDSAGGLLHVGIGFSALALVVFRKHNGSVPISDEFAENGESPASIMLLNLGAFAYWIGLCIVNGALTMHADGRAVAAFMNSHLAASSGALAGYAVSSILSGRAHKSSASTGAIVGLIAASAGCGYMLPETSIITGATSAAICCAIAELLKSWKKRSDATTVFIVQGMAGSLGCGLAGVFATSSVAGFRWDHRQIEGAVEGNVNQVGFQLVGIAAAAIWSLLATSLILMLVRCFFGRKSPSIT